MDSPAAIQKTQPWKKNWPPAQAQACPNGIEYGVEKGNTVVVDGTSANVKPQKAGVVAGETPSA